jgi:hypothetical protein
MMTREELIKQFKPGMKMKIVFSHFYPEGEKGTLTVDKIDVEQFLVYFKKKDKCEIIDVLGAPYRYQFDGKTINTYHNDRVEGWKLVETKVIV